MNEEMGRIEMFDETDVKVVALMVSAGLLLMSAVVSVRLWRKAGADIQNPVELRRIAAVNARVAAADERVAAALEAMVRDGRR